MRLLILIFAALAMCAQVGPGTLADLTGDGSAHKVSATSLIVRTADLTAGAANTGTCRSGDVNITTSRGQIIAAGGSYHYELPENKNFSGASQTFDLSKIYYLCASSDTLAVHYVQ